VQLLEAEEVRYFETSVTSNPYAQYNNPEDPNSEIQRCENLKSQFTFVLCPRFLQLGLTAHRCWHLHFSVVSAVLFWSGCRRWITV